MCILHILIHYMRGDPDGQLEVSCKGVDMGEVRGTGHNRGSL